MTEANAAFQERDEERLRAILHRWETRPEVVNGADLRARLERTVRKIAQVTQRMEEIEQEIIQLAGDQFYQLILQAEDKEIEVGVLIEEMASDLDAEIGDAHKRLRRLQMAV